MFRKLVLFCLCSLIGVFGDKTVSVSVMEGDSVTLHTEIHEEYSNMLWRYGAKKYNIAEFSRNYGIIYTYDVTDGKFRDRLKLDNQTGSLTITNTTTENAGVYQLLISGTTFTLKSFNVSVYARLPVPVIISNSSQCSSPSSSSSNCSLVCSVLNVRDVTLSWYAGISVLSNISASDLNQSINLSLPLEVEYQDKNNYSCVVAYSFINRTQHLEINKVCHTCAVPPVSVSLIVLISAAAGPLMIVVIVVIFCICKKCRKTVNAVQTRQEDRTHSALCKPKTRKKKSKPEGVYENVPKRR